MNTKFFRKIANWFYRKKILSNGSCRVRVLFCVFSYWPKERIRNFERAERELEQIKGKLLQVKQELDFSNNQLAIKNKALLASLNSLSEVEKMAGVTQQQLSESQKMLVVTQEQLSESQKMLVVTQEQLSESKKQETITRKQLSELQQQYRRSESSVIHFRNKLKHLVICPEAIRRDGRFIVSDDFYQRSLLNTKVLKYEIVKIKLKDIRREWDGKLLGLTECHPYKYLAGDVQQYLDYAERNKALGGYEMSAQRFDELIHSLSTEGYDSKYMPFINENNVIYDGQHRCCFLMKEYGGEFEIDAVRIVCAKF